MSAFTPRRVSHAYLQQLAAPPQRVLPLLTPLGEKAWAAGWDPVILHDAEGLQGTVFRTSHPGKPDTLWLLERYDRARHAVRYTRVTPGSDACEIDIALTPSAAGCAATVRYTWTTLGPAGDAVLERFTDEGYEAFMREWEDELNAYLRSLPSGSTVPEAF